MGSALSSAAAALESAITAAAASPEQPEEAQRRKRKSSDRRSDGPRRRRSPALQRQQQGRRRIRPHRAFHGRVQEFLLQPLPHRLLGSPPPPQRRGLLLLRSLPPPEQTVCCFFAVFGRDRLRKLSVETCIIVGEPPRRGQLTEKQLRPNRKKQRHRRKVRDMEDIRAFCPSYEEALQINRTDEQVLSEEEERHFHCC
uniref:Uncharacterized protein n=1 Tax=Leersia perrieri TaxID=77586 RepID=A0A0D9UXA9_9ORYZ